MAAVLLINNLAVPACFQNPNGEADHSRCFYVDLEADGWMDGERRASAFRLLALPPTGRSCLLARRRTSEEGERSSSAVSDSITILMKRIREEFLIRPSAGVEVALRLGLGNSDVGRREDEAVIDCRSGWMDGWMRGLALVQMEGEMDA